MYTFEHRIDKSRHGDATLDRWTIDRNRKQPLLLPCKQIVSPGVTSVMTSPSEVRHRHHQPGVPHHRLSTSSAAHTNASACVYVVRRCPAPNYFPTGSGSTSFLATTPMGPCLNKASIHRMTYRGDTRRHQWTRRFNEAHETRLTTYICIC